MAGQKKIFVSYARADGEGVVEHVRRELAAAGHVAMGDWELVGGDDWTASLSKKLNDADGAIVVVGPAALTSKWVDAETMAMYARTEFRLVVLMLPSVTLMDLQGSSLSRLADTQIPQAPTVEARIAEVVAAFGAETPAGETKSRATGVANDAIAFTTIRRLEIDAAVSAVATGTRNGVPVLAVGTEDAKVSFWKLSGVEHWIPTALHPSKGAVWGLAVLDPFVVIAGQGPEIELDTPSGASSLSGHAAPVNSVAAGLVGGQSIAVSAGDDNVLRVWDLEARNQLSVLAGHEHWVNGVALGRVAGVDAAISGSSDGTVRIWDLTTYDQLLVLQGHEGPVSSVAVSVDGPRPIAVSGGVDGTVRVWDLLTGTQLASLTGHTDAVRAVAVMVVDERVVIVSGGNDRTVRLWDADTGQIGEPLKGHAEAVRAVTVVDLDGTPAVVSGSDDGTVRIWGAVLGDQVEWLSDSTSAADFLKRRPLAAVLAQRLQRQHEKEPGTSFLMHVDGPWGAGKSTLIDFVRADLEQRQWVTVWFDAWREAGVGPPWWALLVALRGGICRKRRLLGRFWLRANETWTRLRRSGAAFVFASALLLAISAAVFFLLRPAQVDAKSVAELAKMVTAVLAALGTLAGGAFVAARLLLWDSARGARLFEQSNANPMQDVARHFHWLMKKAKAPVVFFIDDLDRCPQAYVVELLDAVQTIVRSKNITKDAAASFVVAADGAWIRASYEIEYEKFAPTIAEPGRPLGYLFLDKLFQLHVPVPVLDSPKQRSYLGHLLGLRSSRQVAEEEKSVRERLRNSTSEAHVLETLRQASSEVRDRVAPAAVEKLTVPEVAAATEHQLQKFGPLLRPNPRSMKLFLNAYSVLRIVRTLEGNPVTVETLALWTVLETRWPRLADHLRAQPDHIDLVGKPKGDLEDVPEDLRPLFRDAAVRGLASFHAGGPLTAAAIRSCCGAAETDN